MSTQVAEHVRQLVSRTECGNILDGEAYFLPFQVESLALENVGPFEKFEARFGRDAVTVVYGPAGSGKSTVLRSILLAYGRRHKYFDERALCDGSITLKIFPGQDSVSLRGLEDPGNLTKIYPCLIADDAFHRVNADMLGPVLCELNHLGIQIIITFGTGRDKKTIQANAHVISLEYPYDQLL
jgi:energy-coupling factor transporter ATP-binding protein EcfA2